MMKLLRFAGLGFLVTITSAQAGADFYRMPAIHELQMKAHLIFYGSNFDPASPGKATDEINRLWSSDPSGKPHIVRLDDGDYALRAVLTYEVLPIERVREIAKSNTDPGIHFIRMEKGGNPGDRSFYYLGANCGTFYDSDELGISTTAPHEFGHGLGLPHPDEGDWRGKGVPPVMAPRGTWVDAQYQWDPNAQAGAAGGTVKPHFRKVTHWDLGWLALGTSLHFDARNVAALGEAQNTVLEAGFEHAKNWPTPGWVY
jgi:hypothetical protein